MNDIQGRDVVLRLMLAINGVEVWRRMRLAVKINALIAAQRLNQMAAAARLEVSQPQISAIKNYRLEGFSVERLMSFLRTLGPDQRVAFS